MVNIKISIIIPVYNGEKFICECLDSVINQSLNEIEIICINDGSTDNTLDILNEYSFKDNRIKIITTENNGQGYARNLAIKEVKGEYVLFVDADDYLDLDSCKLLYSRAKSDDLDMLFFQLTNYIESSGNIVNTELYNHKCFIDNGVTESTVFNNATFKDCLFKILVCPVSKLYKTEFLRENNLHFPENMIFEDNLLFYESYFKGNKFGFLKEHLYYRRRHKNSTTQSFNKKFFDIVKVTNLMLDLFKKLDKYDEYKKELINHTFSMINEWFNKSPLYLKNEFFLVIKYNFKGFNELKVDFLNNLKEVYIGLFKCILKSEDYMDFLASNKLLKADYSYVKPNKKYKISIIIPTYNTGNILHRTLMSIENQSFGFENIEVLLIDDASNDNETLNIIKEYCEKYENVNSILLSENIGSPGTSRNIGVREASADYIMFLDHDDFFELDACEKLYSEMLKKDADVVFGRYNAIDDNHFGVIEYPKEKQGYFEDINENERIVAYPPPSIWTKLFKKDLIIKNNILFPPLLGEDAIFMSKVFINAKGIVYLGDLLVCWHDLNDSSTTNNVSFNYLMEGLTSEKYLFEIFSKMDKEIYFKYRCEGNINFFLSQLLKSNLNKDELSELLPIFNWFIRKADEYGLRPSDSNLLLFKFILEENIDSLFEIKNTMAVKYNIINYHKIYENIELKCNDELLNEIINLSEEFKQINLNLSKKINELKNSLVHERKLNKKLIIELKNEKQEKNELIKKIDNLQSFKGWVSNKYFE